MTRLVFLALLLSLPMGVYADHIVTPGGVVFFADNSFNAYERELTRDERVFSPAFLSFTARARAFGAVGVDISIPEGTSGTFIGSFAEQLFLSELPSSVSRTLTARFEVEGSILASAPIRIRPGFDVFRPGVSQIHNLTFGISTYDAITEEDTGGVAGVIQFSDELKINPVGDEAFDVFGDWAYINITGGGARTFPIPGVPPQFLPYEINGVLELELSVHEGVGPTGVATDHYVLSQLLFAESFSGTPFKADFLNTAKLTSLRFSDGTTPASRGIQISTLSGAPPFPDQLSTVPEPASLAIWCVLGLTVAGGDWRRRRKLARA